MKHPTHKEIQPKSKLPQTTPFVTPPHHDLADDSGGMIVSVYTVPKGGGGPAGGGAPACVPPADADANFFKGPSCPSVARRTNTRVTIAPAVPKSQETTAMARLGPSLMSLVYTSSTGTGRFAARNGRESQSCTGSTGQVGTDLSVTASHPGNKAAIGQAFGLSGPTSRNLPPLVRKAHQQDRPSYDVTRP